MEKEFNLKNYIDFWKNQVDLYLDQYLPDPKTFEPKILAESMRYTIFAGGKRLRPILAITTYNLSGGKSVNEIMPFACALEMIHTFSLIHDDLPAMDDDDFRRGKPSSHKVFGEAIAILAGDALFNQAIYTIVNSEVDPKLKVVALKEVLNSTGCYGMIGGQVEDIMGEKETPTEEKVKKIHLMKTASLITTSLVVGALIARLEDTKIDKIREAGTNIGLAFQIVDDYLDETGDEKNLGKKSKKDIQRGKITYPRVFGLEKSLEHAKNYANIAKAKFIEVFQEKATPLVEISDYIVNRIS